MPNLDKNIFSDFLQETEFSRYISVFTTLNMELVQSTIAGAENGNIGDLYQLYELIEVSDARLKGMINNRRKAVTKNKYVVSAGNLDNPKSLDVAEFVTKQIEKLRWRAYLSQLMDGRVYGIQAHQKVWAKNENGQLVIKELIPISKSKIEQANNFYSSSFDFGEILIDKSFYGGDRISAKYLIEQNAITLAVDKDEKSKYDYQGIMRGVARWYLIKLFAIQSWSRYGEKYGFPILTATVSEDQYKANSVLISNLLKSVGSNKYGVLLEGMQTQILNGTSTANIDVFERLIALANTEMAIAILGQNLTTEVNGGSMAASKTHLSVLENLIEDDSEWIDEIVNDQIINPLVKVNFPDLAWSDYPTYKTLMPDKTDIEAAARALSQASQIVPIPISHVYKKLGIPEPQNGEQTIGGFNQLLNSIVNS